MKLIVGTLIIAIAVGYLAGGRLSNLANLQIRWAPLALIGFVMQLINPPGHWPLAMLIGSFVLLSIFAFVNRHVVGFWLILVGVAISGSAAAFRKKRRIVAALGLTVLANGAAVSRPGRSSSPVAT